MPKSERRGGYTAGEPIATVTITLYPNPRWSVGAVDRGEAVGRPVGGAHVSIETATASPLSVTAVCEEAIHQLVSDLRLQAFGEGAVEDG